MKKINHYRDRLLFAALLLISLGSQAQTSQSEVIAHMERRGWEVAESRYAYLQQDQFTTWWYRTFYYGLEYAVVAFSEDGDVLDMNLEVEYGDGREFDYSIDDWATVYITPYVDVRMRIRMENFVSRTPGYASKCHYIVFYR